MELVNHTTGFLGMQASIFGACPKPGYNERVVAGRASGVKMGDDGCGLLISLDGVAPNRTVGVSASVIFRCITKVQEKISSGTVSPG